MSSPAPRPRETSALDTAMCAIARGDRTQVAVVFAVVWPALLRRCSAWLGADADAEDAAQNAMIKLMENAHNYREGDSTLAWALTIAMWECRTIQKSRARRRVDPEAALGDPASSDEDAEAALARHELAELARGVVGRMSPSDMALVLEALASEGEPRSTMRPAERKRRQRAFDRLRDMWRRLYGA